MKVATIDLFCPWTFPVVMSSVRRAGHLLSSSPKFFSLHRASMPLPYRWSSAPTATVPVSKVR